MARFQRFRRFARLRTALPALACVGVGQVVAWPAPAHDLAAPAVAVDWQDPQALPPRFRNHCRYDPGRRRFYCSNHCGIDYQFYFCSAASFGCCRLSHGYCDGRGRLRCAP